MNRRASLPDAGEGGFTLIELLVVVLIIGILASIAVPQYFKVVERSRFSAVNSFFSAIKSSQERFLARAGVYTNNYSLLDITYGGIAGTNGGSLNPQFNVGPLTATDSGCGGESGPSYALTVTRQGASPGRYGAYTVTLNSCTNANALSGIVCGGGAILADAVKCGEITQ